MKNKTHNKSEALLILDIFGDDIHDLSVWSVYNDDLINEELDELKELVNKIKLVILKGGE